MDEATHQARIKRAAEMGDERGTAAASWVFDGNTDDLAYARVLRAIWDGDGAVLEEIRTPDLSGEWAGEETPQSLADALEFGQDYGPDEYDQALQDVCDAWENGVSFAMQRELELTCLRHLQAGALSAPILAALVMHLESWLESADAFGPDELPSGYTSSDLDELGHAVVVLKAMQGAL